MVLWSGKSFSMIFTALGLLADFPASLLVDLLRDHSIIVWRLVDRLPQRVVL
jgi:hypothetical protein